MTVALFPGRFDPVTNGHLDIIERFGRFPHRNKVLARATTGEEQRFLDEGGIVLVREHDDGMGHAGRKTAHIFQRIAIRNTLERPVISDRVRPSLIERLTICEKVARGRRGTFSRIRSKTMTQS